MQKEERLLRIGVLGCGPIAQYAHFDAIRKARNAELYAICDRAADLRERMAGIHQPRVAYGEFDQMLADPQVEAVIVAVADQFHVARCQQSLAAGKHVLVEKPLGVTVEECEQLRHKVQASARVLQVGYMKRFDPGIAYAQRFIREELGQRMLLKAWYCDSVYRYTITGNLQPVALHSPQALRPAGNPKADKRRYYLLTHGSHLVDTARFLGGDIVSVHARLTEKYGAYYWFIAAEFADGGLGHLDLIVSVRGDWEEGFKVHGENGNVTGKTHVPWYHKTSEVECFSVKDGLYRRPLGEDAHTYKLQIEAWAEAILTQAPQRGANVDDGAQGVRALVAIARSVELGQPVLLADVKGAV